MPIRSGAEYIESLRKRKLKVYYLGQLIENPVDHPVIRPSINAVAETYDLANREPELGSAHSSLIGKKVNRFLHITESAEDVVLQNKMQRRLGQLTGTCFQRCVGMDALNSLYSVTYEIDEKYKTEYHKRFIDFVRYVQEENLVIGGAMTDPKGDRSVSPSKQIDPDLFLHVVKKTDEGIVIRGAKAHQTGCINSHWLIFMPTQRLEPGEEDYAVSCAVPVDAPGLTYIYGRQACDTRIVDGGEIDAGNSMYSGQEALIVVEDVFVPWKYVFMCGEIEFVPILVDRFTAYHRRSYVCKTGVGDVLIGAAALVADYNGVGDKSHIKEKLVEMAHLNETIYGTGMASSFLSYKTKAGNWQCDSMLANVCKHNVTRFPYEIARLAQDLAGGIVVTLPSEKDLRNPETGHLLRKFFATKENVDPEDRMRIIRLIENMTIGRNAVGYLTESLHGAGSPQAQRIVISRLMQIEEKKKLAKRLAKIKDLEEQVKKATAKIT
ncbi:MAG: 4-hydroxyphenylacetate 3-hydroxylase N-terminal domain-containing protein [Nitrososphaerales archaeon]